VTNIENAVRTLQDGGIVVIPTDTVYGVAARSDVSGAEDRIYQLKGRDRKKPLPLLAADLGAVQAYGARIGPLERRLADRFWPGPLTIILKVDGGTEGFRVPDHPVAVELIRAAGGTLRVTSANLSGEPPALTADEAVKSLGDGVDAVVDAGRTPGATPSTVVAIEGDEEAWTLNVLRDGVISRAELESVLNG
jgi:L-threonylcarbamoyladenylate synthase